jgi:hypothetical protein
LQLRIITLRIEYNLRGNILKGIFFPFREESNWSFMVYTVEQEL